MGTKRTWDYSRWWRKELFGFPQNFIRTHYDRQHNRLSKDIHLLILETCEHSGLHGKRNFEDVIKVNGFRWKFILDYPNRSNLIIWVLKSEENSPAAENQRDNLRKTQQYLWRRRRGTKSLGMWVAPRCWNRQGSGIFPGVLWKECRLGDTLILAQ